MDYREASFKKKFGNAARCLDVKPYQVVSLKLRDNVGSYQEYRDLVDSLERDAGLQCSRVDADLQGQGYLLSDGKTKAIVVEHETGLEILYIAGSIASLIGLVPMVLQGWYALRGRLFGRRGVGTDSIEVRRTDKSGHLHEETAHGFPTTFLAPMGTISRELMAAASQVESEVKGLSQQVESLNSRVEALEEQVSVSPRPTSGRKEAAKSARSRATGKAAGAKKH